MGQSCNLYLNPKWDDMTIKDVVERVSGQKAKWQPTGQAGFDYLIGDDFQIAVFWNSKTPIGSFINLSRGSQGADLLKKVAEVLGGLLEASDYDGKMEMIDGKTSEENALPYFVNYAIARDDANPNSIPDLIESIKKWEREVSSNTKIIMPELRL